MITFFCFFSPATAMLTRQFFQHFLYINFSLWTSVVTEASSVPQLSDIEWLRNSISHAEANKFCADIMKMCNGPSNNFTSTKDSHSPCGVVECCRYSALLERSRSPFSQKLFSAKELQLKNICITKWTFSEMLEGDGALKFDALRKIDKFISLEKESAYRNIKERLQLAFDLKQIAHGIVKSQSLPSSQEGTPYLESENDSVRIKRSSVRRRRRRRHRMAPRSANANCQMRVGTVLVSYSPYCYSKSIFIWYCTGTCNSRSVPQYYDAINNVRSVEHCTCCSAGTMKYKSLVFTCTGGNIQRTVAWPFDCACRPCSSVPNLVAQTAS